MTTKDQRDVKAKHKRDERERKRMAGLVPKEIWVRLQDWPRIEKYLKRMASKTREN